MIHWLAKGADYSPATEEMYRNFLRGRYSSVSALNRAYGTGYLDFAEIKQPLSGEFGQNKNMLWDWMHFYQQYFAAYYYSLYKPYAAQGLKLPVLANIPQFYDFDVRGRGIYSPMTSMMFRDFPKYVPQVIFGGAYQMRRLDYENFHDVAVTTEVVKSITNPGIPSVCAELQTGILKDNPRLYPADIELNLKSSAAHGLNGLNCYMFSGGANEEVFSGMGSRHEWQAPVCSNGGIRDHFQPLKEFGGIIKSFGRQLSDTEKAYDIAVGFYPAYYETEFLSGPEIEKLENRKLKLFYDGICRLLQLANINFRFVDIQKAPDAELKKYPSLFVFSLEFMDEATQSKLAAYAAAGGKLILNPALPEKNLNMEKCTILSDALGISPSGKAERAFYLMNGLDYMAEGEVNTFTAPPDGNIIATALDKRPCAVQVQVGKGTAVASGMGMYHLFDYHIDVIRELAALVGAKPSIKVQKDLQVTLRKNSDYGFLFLTNYNDVPRETKVTMTLPGETKAVTFPSSGILRIMNRRGYIIPLNVPFSSGGKIRYATAEILGIRESGTRKEISLRGPINSQAELELILSAKQVKLDGKKAAFTKKKSGVLIRFTANGKIQKLEVRL
jgi:beta-galactosidase